MNTLEQALQEQFTYQRKRVEAEEANNDGWVDPIGNVWEVHPDNCDHPANEIEQMHTHDGVMINEYYCGACGEEMDTDR